MKYSRIKINKPGLDPITVLELDNEKGTQSQLTWFLSENVDNTPKWHLGVLDLTLLTCEKLLTTYG